MGHSGEQKWNVTLLCENNRTGPGKGTFIAIDSGKNGWGIDNSILWHRNARNRWNYFPNVLCWQTGGRKRSLYILIITFQLPWFLLNNFLWRPVHSIEIAFLI